MPGTSPIRSALSRSASATSPRVRIRRANTTGCRTRAPFCSATSRWAAPATTTAPACCGGGSRARIWAWSRAACPPRSACRAGSGSLSVTTNCCGTDPTAIRRPTTAPAPTPSACPQPGRFLPWQEAAAATRSAREASSRRLATRPSSVRQRRTMGRWSVRPRLRRPWSTLPRMPTCRCSTTSTFRRNARRSTSASPTTSPDAGNSTPTSGPSTGTG